MTTRVSVALASYNGAAYIAEQLDSLARQERLPDELVVCDDGSSDQTVEITRRFAADAPFPVRIEQNPVRLGVAKNFEKALSLCTGDLIFLADQDDVWFPSKIGTMQGALEANPDVLIGMNDAVIVDHDLAPIAPSLFSNIVRATGREEAFYWACCMVITRAFRDFCLPLPVGEESSDGWLNFAGLLLGVKRVSRMPLQYYRRHGGNVSTSPAYDGRLSGFVRFKLEHDLFREFQRDSAGHTGALVERLWGIEVVLERLERLRSVAEPARLLLWTERLQKRKQNLERRIEISRLPKLRRVVAATPFLFVGGYKDARGVRSFLVDISK